MNYFNTWLVDTTPAHSLFPGKTVNLMGNHMCGRHLMEVRRVHIEKNTALQALGW